MGEPAPLSASMGACMQLQPGQQARAAERSPAGCSLGHGELEGGGGGEDVQYIFLVQLLIIRFARLPLSGKIRQT